MARQQLYRLTRPKRKRNGGKIIALLLLLGLGITLWVWWRNRPQPPASPTRSPTVVAQPNQPPAKPITTPVRTNLGLSKSITKAPAATPRPAPPAAADFPRPARDGFETQVALARRGISSGSLDGVMGSQTRAALRAFQRQASLTETRELDADLRAQLSLDTPPLTNYVVTSNDLA